MTKPSWTVADAARLYQIDRWSGGFFRVNARGNLDALADPERRIDLKGLCDELASRGLHPPILLRFSDLLIRRMKELHQRFARAREEVGYRGKYYGVYPIKVNQQRQIVEEIVEYGAEFDWGLEAGSKPELHATLAMLESVEGLIVCNGYKDREFVELALMGLKMGKRVFVVVEKPDELPRILSVARRLKVRPLIGLRCRLAATSNGLWDDSGGDMSKFGLSPSDLLAAIERLRAVDMLDSLQMLHFHIGSQVPEMRRVKDAMQEAARFFVEARKLGAPIDLVDVGGGLGVNYGGGVSDATSCVNYSLQEYANDVVWILMQACDQANLDHPHIVSESGRALVAHHAVLVVDVAGVARRVDDSPLEEPGEGRPPQLYQLWETLRDLGHGLAPREALHDAVALRADVTKLFSLGHASLADRALADDIYWRLMTRILERLDGDELDRLMPRLRVQAADRYYCNFSVFQSLPDSWAIGQLFPVMPIQRLDEEPSRRALLVDITCDSDGTIKQFPVAGEISPTLPLHPLESGDSYLIGIFMVGAYQEILGDLHNLFGDTHAVHVRMDGDKYELEQVVAGESVAEVLDYVQFNERVLMDRMRRQLQKARDEGRISAREMVAFQRVYEEGLKGYTYLEEDAPTHPNGGRGQ
jgi:arginine decarboxylase